MEEWKTIESLEHKYAVSNLGRVKNVKTDKVLKTTEFKDSGYQKIGITFNKRTCTFFIHRLVLSTFKPIDNPDDFDVDHIDLNRGNNKLENLQWLTSQRNCMKKMRHTKSYLTYTNLLIRLGDEVLNELLLAIK